MTLLEVNQLTKKFGTTVAVDQVSFSLKNRKCTALLGPNGAGKTTILSMLAGLMHQTAGTISFTGLGANQDHRASIGYLPQYPVFYEWMTGVEFLEYVGKLALLSGQEAKQNALDLLALVGLEDAGKKRIGGYSGGMKQRLGIAQAMIHRPRLLMLDEPVSALDPLGRREVLEMIKTIKRETTILFSSHILNDAEEISDEVLILHHGSMLVSGTLNELKQQYRQSVIHLATDGDCQKWFQQWEQWDVIEKIEYSGTEASVRVRDLEQGKRLILQDVLDHQIPLTKFEVGKVTLEDLFMKVVRS